ncbi:MAG: hypothetical protein N838_23280 [Thiohalocapsa sp. PB-PSB1]|jgi:hypothetical protein|nr:MAG: hypothetical protein N838_26555 [Thiohalocapsa sp. PB-PSB1]QQO55830.1 MAG: hypothetical protein N838_23280 [Thiohalocapsa sp. PB-PSB1]
MPDHLRKPLGILLIFIAIGVASTQALLASCSSPAMAASAGQAVVVRH